MTSILKVDEIQNTDGKTGIVITPDGSLESVKFPEQSSPSGRVITSTTMSSFEEGTWVPILEFRDGNAGSIAYTSQRFGSYVKIGRSVQITARVGWDANNITDSQGAFCMKGLPFTVSGNEGERGGAAITYSEEIVTNVSDVTSMAFRGEMNRKHMIFNFIRLNGGALNEQITNTANLNSSGGFILFGHYQTDE